MSERGPRHTERRTVFVLAGLLLTSLVSIAFYNLHQHPAFLSPTDEFVSELDEAESSLISAADPIALAALEERQSDLRASTVPLADWPPRTSVFTFGSTPTAFEDAEMQSTATESVWTLWSAPETFDTPPFATARVEVESPDGRVRTCRLDARGGHQCGEAGWTRVRRRELTIDGETEECIWAHPLDGEILRIRYPEVVPLDADGRRLVFETGLRDDAVGRNVPVEFRLLVGDRTETHIHRDRRGWQSTSVPVVDGAVPLVIEVTADDVGRRHTCFRFKRP